MLGLDVEPAAEAAVAAARFAGKRRRTLWLPLLAALALAPPVIVVAYVFGEVADNEPAGKFDSLVQASPVVVGTAKPARATAPPGRPVRLVLTADRGPSWVEARSGSPTGPLLFEGTLARGRERRMAAGRIWIRLGAASNLSLTVNGRPAPTELFGTVDVLVTARGIRPA